jgi:DNA-binding MarR family transcriptional regulator
MYEFEYNEQKIGDGSLGYQLSQLFWKLGPAYCRWVEDKLKKSGTTPHRLRVIRLLCNQGAIPMKKLADQVGVTSATMTGLIDALEKDGRVQRVPHPSDRRISLIEVTPETKQKFSGAVSGYNKDISTLFDIFSDEEKVHLLSFLSRIQDALVEGGTLAGKENKGPRS